MLPASTAVVDEADVVLPLHALHACRTHATMMTKADASPSKRLASSFVSMVAYVHDDDIAGRRDIIVGVSYIGKTPKK